MRVPARFDRDDRDEHVRIEPPALGIDENAAREVAALPARHLRIDVAQHLRVDGDRCRRRGHRCLGGLRGRASGRQRAAKQTQQSPGGWRRSSHMSLVGSSPGAPPGSGASGKSSHDEPPYVARPARWAIGIVAFFVVMCGDDRLVAMVRDSRKRSEVSSAHARARRAKHVL